MITERDRDKPTGRALRELDERVVVITGGSQGIGLAIAQELDARGAHVVVASRDANRVARAVATLSGGVGFPDCDVRDPQAVDALFDFVAARFGRLDALVLSAGIGRGYSVPLGNPRPVVKLGETEWDEVIDTNLRGAFLASRAAARQMTPRRSGQILNISSARAAVRGQPCGAAYSASKMAVRIMFESLAAELAPFGVRVMSLLPDAVDTSLIAGTSLAPRGAMTSGNVARFVAYMLSLPPEVTFEEPLLAPFCSQQVEVALRRSSK